MVRGACVLASASIVAIMPVAAQTLQERYAAAQAAFDAGRWADAYQGFTAILPRLKADATGAIVRARAGAAALNSGRAEEAVALIDAALPKLTGDERTQALLDLGRAREAIGETTQARAAYAEAAKASGSQVPLSLRLAIARTTLFDDPASAAAQLDALRPEVETQLKDKREPLAELYLLRGRADLAVGRIEEGRRWFQRALSSAGGLSTSRVSITDARVRGDLAIANFLLGNADAAREYLAYSGAGYAADQGLTGGAEMPPAACAANGLTPDDMGIVEVAISDDGRAASAQPVYANRPAAAPAFARAAKRWSWAPDAIVKVPGWWRAAVRFQMRCADTRPAIVSPNLFSGELTAWLLSRGVQPFRPTGTDAATLPLIRSELDRRGPAGALPRIPVLLALADNDAAPRETRVSAIGEARDTAIREGGPADVLTALRVATIATEHSNGDRRTFEARMRASADAISALIAELDSSGQGNSRGMAYALSELGAARTGVRDSAGAVAAFRRVTALPDTVLPPADPMRQAALLRLASAEAAAARPGEAARLYAATGLAPNQCALVEAKPTIRRMSIGADAFPTYARQWGFEGFVVTAYDIDVDGTPSNVRAVIASPPFAFSDATAKAVSRFRFEPVFRPDGGSGCTGFTQRVNWRIAG